MGQRPTRRAPRGQAMVELVLGTIVFVTVLIFAIHFAEIGFLSLKVTEAQHSAIFDATGHKLHQWPKDESPASGAASKAAKAAQGRYADFDSRTSSPGASLSQVFTRAQNLRVQCEVGQGGNVQYSQAGVTKNAYTDNGRVSCTASAEVSGTGIARSFLDQGGGAFFKTAHYVPTTIRVCGIGRGTCSGRLSMLLDDWGLSGANESKNCKMTMDSPGCQNQPFWDMAETVFKKNGSAMGAAGTAFAMGIVNLSPINENRFWMSAPGEESGFMQKISPSEGAKNFETTPGAKGKYKESYDMRKTCWLGLECP